jgi:hypothetical protein
MAPLVDKRLELGEGNTLQINRRTAFRHVTGLLRFALNDN